VDDLLLQLQGEAVAEALGVDLLRVEPLELQRDGVLAAVGKAHHLVLERGAVARADPRDDAGV